MCSYLVCGCWNRSCWPVYWRLLKVWNQAVTKYPLAPRMSTLQSVMSRGIGPNSRISRFYSRVQTKISTTDIERIKLAAVFVSVCNGDSCLVEQWHKPLQKAQCFIQQDHPATWILFTSTDIGVIHIVRVVMVHTHLEHPKPLFGAKWCNSDVTKSFR